MIETFNAVIKWVGGLFKTFTETPIEELTCFKLLVIIVFCIISFYLLKYTLRFLVIGSKSCYKKIRNKIKSSKEKCAKIQCPYCGRTLDKCVCTSNQKLSYKERLKAYKAKLKK